MQLNQFFTSAFAALGITVSANSLATGTTDTIPFISELIVVDGQLDEPHWQQAKRVPINNITWPYENLPAPVDSYALIYEDSHTLYVAFVANDHEPHNIRAFYKDRDSAWDDDMVGIKIDTYGSSQLAYQFFVNPLGVQHDAIENEINKSESSAWDGIWDSAGIITEAGYQVELALPMRMFNFDDVDALKNLQMEFVRFYPRSERLRISSMEIDHANHCWICQMPQTQGFAKARQSNHLTLVPSLVLSQDQSRDVKANDSDWDKDNNMEPSLDVKWGITPDLTLNATLNPDFSQVEADVAQLSINNSFSLFFDEKRSFFLDNADYFSSNLNLVYTRNIASPNFGAKLTGSNNGHTVAAFVSDDEYTNVIIPGNLGSSLVSLDDKSHSAAFRYRYDSSKSLSIGTNITARSSDDYHNALVSIDSKYKFSDFTTLQVQLMGSNSSYSDAFINSLCDSSKECAKEAITPCSNRYDCSYSEALLRVKDGDYDGHGYFVALNHDTKYYSVFSNFHNRSAGLRADLGFLAETDFNKWTSGGEYRWYGDETTWWNRTRWYTDWDITHNEAGELLEKEAQTSVMVDGPLQSFIELGAISRERRGLRHDPSSLVIEGNADRFNENEIIFFAGFKPTAGLNTDIDIRFGNKVDLANNRPAERFYVRPTLNYNATKHLNVRVRHTFEELETTTGDDIFTANLSDIRLSYQFNLNSFLRLSVIHTDIERNADNYIANVDEHYKSLSTQLLYSYKLNPQSVVFLGYSDNGYQDDDLSSIRKNQRTLFAKFSYAWIL